MYVEQVFAQSSDTRKISVEDTLNPAPGVYLVLHYGSGRRLTLFIPTEAWNRLREVEPGKL